MEENRSDDSSPYEDGKQYDIEGYKKLEIEKGIPTLLGIGMLFFAIYGSYSIEGFFAVLIVVAFIYVIYLFKHTKTIKKHNDKISEGKYKENLAIQKISEEAYGGIKQANKQLNEQMKTMEDIKAANKKGDIIITGNSAPVIIDSTVTNSFNAVNTDDPELADAIKTLAGYVENSGNKKAAVVFNELHKKIAEENRSPTIIEALWNGLISVLPEIEKITTVSEKIRLLFS